MWSVCGRMKATYLALHDIVLYTSELTYTTTITYVHNNFSHEGSRCSPTEWTAERSLRMQLKEIQISTLHHTNPPPILEHHYTAQSRKCTSKRPWDKILTGDHLAYLPPEQDKAQATQLSTPRQALPHLWASKGEAYHWLPTHTTSIGFCLDKHQLRRRQGLWGLWPQNTLPNVGLVRS